MKTLKKMWKQKELYLIVLPVLLYYLLSQRTLIPPITLKEDESKQYSVLSTQMNTFISEYSAKFYTQVLDVDTEWDNYIKQLNDMGMNDMIGIYQSALDRYNER